VEGPGRGCTERRIAAVDTRTEAIRPLRRRLSDVVFRVLLAEDLVKRNFAAERPNALWVNRRRRCGMWRPGRASEERPRDERQVALAGTPLKLAA
jgi:hypothetical protein